MTSVELEKLLKTEIPISNELGIHSLILKDNELSFILPLIPNRNHKGTLFGGSLYSAAALSCYGLFLIGLQENNILTKNIVISDGSIKYLYPVDRDAYVFAKWGSHSEQMQFFKTLSSKKKARTTMSAQITVDNKICAEFRGDFVAVLD